MWSDVLQSKIHDLELIASWASQVALGSVRDHCRMAIYDLKQRRDFILSVEKPPIEDAGQ